MWNVERLGGKHEFKFEPDAAGYVGRECPVPECMRYFKIVSGTGLEGKDLPCHCPYCGHVGSHQTFHTPEQIEWVTSLMRRKFEEAMFKDIQEVFRPLQRNRTRGLISLSVEVKRGGPTGIRHYTEKQLEEHVTCSACTLKYAVYGTFAFCPDCGTHNSQQILDKNLDLVEQQLVLAATVQGELASRLVEDALENVVSAFDGFGREASRVHASAATDPAKAENASFQNLVGAQQRVLALFGVNLSAAVPAADWSSACRSFQKRHVIAHKMGVVDQDYIDKTTDSHVRVGQKMPLDAQEVRALSAVVRVLGAFLVANLP